MNAEDVPAEEYRGLVFAVERMTDCIARGETQPLNAAHWDETEGYRHSQGMKVNYQSYVSMEGCGQLLYFTARRDGKLVGHLVYIVYTNRHSSTLTAVEDFFYFIREERAGYTAVSLLRYAIRVLKACGCKEIGMSSKLTNDIDALLKRVGFKHVANFYTMNAE